MTSHIYVRGSTQGHGFLFGDRRRANMATSGSAASASAAFPEGKKRELVRDTKDVCGDFGKVVSAFAPRPHPGRAGAAARRAPSPPDSRGAGASVDIERRCENKKAGQAARSSCGRHLQVLHLLLQKPTSDSVEMAVNFTKELLSGREETPKARAG